MEFARDQDQFDRRANFMLVAARNVLSESRRPGSVHCAADFLPDHAEFGALPAIRQHCSNSQ